MGRQVVYLLNKNCKHFVFVICLMTATKLGLHKSVSPLDNSQQKGETHTLLPPKEDLDFCSSDGNPSFNVLFLL